MSDFKSSIPEVNGPLSASELRRLYSNCADYEQREIAPGLKNGSRVTVCWLDGVADGDAISEDILRPLTESARAEGVSGPDELLGRLERGAVYSCVVERRTTLSQVCADVAQGFAAVVFEELGEALCFEVRTKNSRSVSEPSIEKTVKGAKDAFVETLRVNTSLVRRKLRSPGLKVEQTIVGRRSGTTVAILYVEGVARDGVVDELRRRLDSIDIDALLTAGDLEEYIVDRPSTPFPQLLHTERADTFAARLLDGRVGLLADGLPIGFLLPATFEGFMRTAEDEARHFAVASILTLLRWLALVMSLALPALLVAIASYHQEMIPTGLLLSMIDAKQDVPFSVAVEVLTMLIAFELLQEAGLRLPDPVGQTVSIIGALIVGQSAVEARVVSPIAVIIVAAAGISGYAMPSQDISGAVRIWRLILVLLAVLGGLFGVSAGVIMLVWRLCSIESFGTAYTSPFTDGGIRHGLIRRPLRLDKLRPPHIADDLRRQG